jgi:hypothetical protein
MALSELLHPGDLIDPATTFEGRDGRVSLQQLFGGRRWLIVHHTVSAPGGPAEPPPPPMGDLLRHRDARLVLVSRAPIAMLDQYRRYLGHDLPCYRLCESASTARPPESWDQFPVLSVLRLEDAEVVHHSTIPLPGPGSLAGVLELLQPQERH